MNSVQTQSWLSEGEEIWTFMSGPKGTQPEQGNDLCYISNFYWLKQKSDSKIWLLSKNVLLCCKYHEFLMGGNV